MDDVKLNPLEVYMFPKIHKITIVVTIQVAKLEFSF